MCEIRVGTSGYDYPEWKGVFYPADLPRSQYLSYYAAAFSSLELNFSYYRMPTAAQLASLMERAGSSCLLSIKAHESLTHSVDLAQWHSALAEFRAALLPLLRAERLGAVLFQFPHSFGYEPERRRYLDSLLKETNELPVVVEFRNHDWYNNRVFDAFRERRVAMASVDLPNLRGLPPVVDLVTSPLAYIRFHGRNEANWWGSDAATRYDYLYDERELEPWVERVKGMAGKVSRLLAYFNNHFRGQAVQNARSFIALLEEAGLAPQQAGLAPQAMSEAPPEATPEATPQQADPGAPHGADPS
ncbi:MAG TPA: DUF72 domain-containing protein [Rectinemataceae bacterium]|nr:DUF72 domain-containing protein [Rectinemataceae bacterium]